MLDSGASVHTSRLRSVATAGGGIEWRSSAALPAARKGEVPASHAAQNHSAPQECHPEARDLEDQTATAVSSPQRRPSVPSVTPSDAAAALSARVKHEQAEPPLLSGPAAAAAATPRRPCSALLPARSNGHELPLAKKARSVSHLNPLGAGREASGQVKEGGPRSGAIAGPGHAVGSTAVRAGGSTAVRTGGEAVLVADAPRGSGAAGASALPAHVPGAATAPLSSRAIAGDDVALEALLRQAAVMTAGAGADKASLLHAVTGWFDRWDSGMGELRGGEVIPLQGLTVPSHFFMGRTSLDGDVPDPY